MKYYFQWLAPWLCENIPIPYFFYMYGQESEEVAYEPEKSDVNRREFLLIIAVNMNSDKSK